ncbi:MAG TPA: DNA cytosine methyltransferase [Vineibacter sp.]|nr:DNA cytosine methyltransferase [Vineibacter sp.]
MVAWYNENDPYAARWLRNLVAAGHLPAGDVDQRSILDVEPGDLDGYDECHFFAGIGGWPYALGLAGWTGPVWTGSCPCQPLSSAGQRKGHADERHLWPAFYRLIAECRPPAVIGEQIASADGREWLAGVRADMEHLGYAVGARRSAGCGRRRAAHPAAPVLGGAVRQPTMRRTVLATSNRGKAGC